MTTGCRIEMTFSGYSSRRLSRRDHEWYTHVASDAFNTCGGDATGPRRLVAVRSLDIWQRHEPQRSCDTPRK